MADIRGACASFCCVLAMLLVVMGLAAVPRPARAASTYLQVFVRAPYLELHTGPGRGYPVFNVVDRDLSVDVLKRYTDWFKVRTTSGVEGWVSAHDMEQTALADGTPFHYDVGDLNAFTSHRFEAGAFFYGDYGGASALSVYGAVFANPNLAAELGRGVPREGLGWHDGGSRAGTHLLSAGAAGAVRDARNRRGAHRAQGHLGGAG
jgi:hypothetical protein